MFDVLSNFICKPYMNYQGNINVTWFLYTASYTCICTYYLLNYILSKENICTRMHLRKWNIQTNIYNKVLNSMSNAFLTHWQKKLKIIEMFIMLFLHTDKNSCQQHIECLSYIHTKIKHKALFQMLSFLTDNINLNHNSPHYKQCQVESPCCLSCCTVSSEILCFTYPRMCFT